MSFKFGLNQLVEIHVSGEFGAVKARAEYADKSENGYFVHYKDAMGCAVNKWFDESDLVRVEAEEAPGQPVFGVTELPPGAKVEEAHHPLTATINIHCTGNAYLSALNTQLKTAEALLAKERGELHITGENVTATAEAIEYKLGQAVKLNNAAGDVGFIRSITTTSDPSTTYSIRTVNGLSTISGLEVGDFSPTSVPEHLSAYRSNKVI